MRHKPESKDFSWLAQALADITGESVDLAVRRAVQERLQRRLANRAQAMALADDLAMLGGGRPTSDVSVMAAA